MNTRTTNFTFLDLDQVSGSDRLDILKEYGKKCAITDFSILLGGHVSLYDYTIEGRTNKDRTGWWWTETPNNNLTYIVREDGLDDKMYSFFRDGGARPVLPYSSIQLFSFDKEKGIEGIKETEYGEYPQTVVDEKYSGELENAYNNRSLKTTGKSYTTDSVNYGDYDTDFVARTHTEYEYNGNKYIRFIGDRNCKGMILSDGRTIYEGEPYWVRVEPITWLVDKKADIVLSKKIIFSGVRFDSNKTKNRDFDKSEIKKFMDDYFSKDIIPSYSIDIDLNQAGDLIKNKFKNNEKKPTKKQNPYGFNFEGVTEEDIIKGSVQSNISVFLHGRSSEGKSARVKQLDPDCEIIYMRNATPESLNGKSVYNASTGEMIDVPPTWYTKVKEKCEVEPNKIHIIFFDELTNALPSIQGMAFNIILDGEVNGKWKLPSNARIVAAGNDLNDSLAANQMAEPLFNRFAHVYINTTVDSWLKWASTPKEKYERLDYIESEKTAKIHPAIYSYIAYKSYSGRDVLRTPYNGEKPNADPRKWEMASKVLYKTNQPEMLRALIGDDLTRDFVEFTKQQVITVEDVINHNYSSTDLNMNVAQKFATAVGLSSVDEEHFMVVRNFMKKVGAEPRAAFESMWAHGDEKRLEIIAEAQMADTLSQEEMIR